MKLNKKGQAEDFLADLIPSLVIIVIGLFILSQMNTENKTTTNNKMFLLEGALRTEISTAADYLSQEVDIDNKKIPLSELISLSYKNDAYESKLRETIWKGQEKVITEAIAETVKQERVEYIQKEMKECVRAEITYPDKSKLELGECEGTSEILALPTYEGEYVMVNLTRGPV